VESEPLWLGRGPNDCGELARELLGLPVGRANAQRSGLGQLPTAPESRTFPSQVFTFAGLAGAGCVGIPHFSWMPPRPCQK
jgi:hypothetical protein